MFDIRFFKVSLLIRLAAVQARGGALMKLPQNGIVSFLIRLAVFLARGTARVKLHSSCDARIRATTDDFSHETHEKTRNSIFIFVQFRGFRGRQYSQ